MDLRSVSVKELARQLLPLLKRNFLEWKRLKKEMFSKSKVKDESRDEDKIEKIILSEPVAAFYAHWLKFADKNNGDQNLQEKIVNYIKGVFGEELKDEKTIKMFYAKCNLIASIHQNTSIKMIDSALALQSLMDKEGMSLQDIFQNEKAFRIITKSSMSVEEWRLSSAISLGWITKFETTTGDMRKITQASHIVLSKREKELFS